MLRLFYMFSAILVLLMFAPMQAHSERIWTFYPTEPAMSDVRDITEDKNIIWLATTTGIVRYDKNTGAYAKYSIGYSAYDWYYQWATAIQVDENGNVWAGTYGAGLMLFDGEGFFFYESPDEPDEKNIQDIEMDGNGTLWMVTENGMIAYDGQNWHVHDETNGLPALTTFYDASIGPDNTVWLATSSGLCRYRDREWVLLRPVVQSAPENYFINVSADQNNNVWIGTGQRGMVRFDGSDFTFISGTDGPAANTIYDVKAGHTEDIWAGTTNGLFKYHIDAWESYTTEDGLPENKCQTLLIDDNGDLFIGQKTGLTVYDYEDFSQINYEHCFPTEEIMSLAAGKGKIWVGYNSGDGIGCFDGSKWQRFTTEQGLPGNYADDIAIADDGTPWFAIHIYLVCYKDGQFVTLPAFEGFSDQFIHEIEIDHNGIVWFRNQNQIGRYDGGSFTYYDMKQLIQYDFSLHTFFVDRNNRLWVGTDNAVSMYDGGSWTTHSTGDFHDVNDIAEDLDGVMWFTTGDGIIRFDGNNWTTFNYDDVRSVAVDKNNIKWFGTRQYGILWYNDAVFQSKEMKEGDSYISTNGIAVGDDNIVWFNTSEGLWSCSDPSPVNISEEYVLPRLQLLEPYPNPFNPATTIPFIISEEQRITVDIIDIQGQIVDRLTDDVLAPGHHAIRWDATGNASGVYFCLIRSGKVQFARKMLLVK